MGNGLKVEIAVKVHFFSLSSCSRKYKIVAEIINYLDGDCPTLTGLSEAIDKDEKKVCCEEEFSFNVY